MSDFKIVEIAVYNRKNVPLEGTTIFDEIEWAEEIYDSIKEIDVFKRSPHDCQDGIGHWICDITFEDGKIICFKLPRKMSYKKVMDYYRPLIAKIRKLQ